MARTIFRVTEGDASRRDKLIALRLSAPEKQTLLDRLHAAGYTSFQAFLDSALDSSLQDIPLTADEIHYELVKEKADAIWRRLGHRKIRIIAQLYRVCARELDYPPACYEKPIRQIPDDFGKIFGRITRMTSKADGSGIRIIDVILAKKWWGYWKQLYELEERLGQKDASEGLRPTPPMAADEGPSPPGDSGSISTVVVEPAPGGKEEEG
jgi:hypothetical protein